MKVAALQYTASADLEANLSKLESMLETCHKTKVDMCLLPENFALMPVSSSQKLAIQEHHQKGRVQDWLAKMSAKFGLYLIAGSFPIESNDPKRPYARCLVYDNTGCLISYYDKIHLFDVGVSANESYCESTDTMAASKPVIVDIKGFKVGLSICYDLRFPELYRYYQTQGVELIVAPSAFTYVTGKAHWDTLLKARAVENLCYLLAANQTGVHDNERRTYGHSKIIDPWGADLIQLAEEEGIISYQISKEVIASIRERFPAHTHRVNFL